MGSSGAIDKLQQIVGIALAPALGKDERAQPYAGFLNETRNLAAGFAAVQHPDEHQLDTELEELRFFSVPKPSFRS